MLGIMQTVSPKTRTVTTRERLSVSPKKVPPAAAITSSSRFENSTAKAFSRVAAPVKAAKGKKFLGVDRVMQRDCSTGECQVKCRVPYLVASTMSCTNQFSRASSVVRVAARADTSKLSSNLRYNGKKRGDRDGCGRCQFGVKTLTQTHKLMQ